MSGPFLVSLRSTHTSPLLPAFVLDFLTQLARAFPTLPVHICYECDSDFALADLIAAYNQPATPRYQDAPDTLCQLGIEHDRALLKLLQFIQSKPYHFVTTDLKGINQIPLGSERARDLLPTREAQMAKCLSDIADSVTSGIIVDIGGFVHQGNLKQIMQTTHPLLHAQYISIIPARDETVNAKLLSHFSKKHPDLAWHLGSQHKEDHDIILPLIQSLIAWLQSLLTPAPALLYTDTAKTTSVTDTPPARSLHALLHLS